MSFNFITRLRDRKNLIVIAGNSAWLLGDKVLRVALGFIVSAVVARYLGPAPFGILSTVFAYVSLLASLATFSLDGLVVRELVKSGESKESILGTAFFLKCGGGVITFILGSSLAYLSGFDLDGFSLLIAVALGSILFQAIDVIDFHFQSQLNGRAIALARSSSFIVISGVKLVFVIVGAPLIYFAATPTIEAAIAAILLAIIYTRYGGSLRAWRFEKTKAINLLKVGLPIAVSGFFVVAIMQIDKLMLGQISGAESVGIYSAASLVSTTWYMVPVVVGASVAPTLTRLYDLDLGNFTNKLQDVFSAVTFISLCVGIITTLLSGPLINFIFGEAYSAASLVLTIHIWTGLFISHVSIRTRALLIEGHMSSILLLSGLTLLANVILNIILIRSYAEVGAATASLLSWALCALFFPLAFNRSRGYALMLLRSSSPSVWIRAIIK